MDMVRVRLTSASHRKLHLAWELVAVGKRLEEAVDSGEEEQRGNHMAEALEALGTLEVFQP